MTAPTEDAARGPRGPVALTLFAIVAACVFAGFVALGNWQVHRLAWKTTLIAHVNARVNAPPVAAPGPDEWERVNVDADEYRHVQVSGVLLNDRQTLVWTASDEGSGFWVMTPLRTADGSIVMINRGFAPTDWCGRDGHCTAGPADQVTITGLLRMPEPQGFLRHNDPAHDSWYTRDIAAMATARGLHDVAPYFIDADALATKSAQPSWPEGGKTVIDFPNNHFSYLVTWYLLALMTLVASVYVGYEEYKLRRALKAPKPRG